MQKIKEQDMVGGAASCSCPCLGYELKPCERFPVFKQKHTFLIYFLNKTRFFFFFSFSPRNQFKGIIIIFKQVIKNDLFKNIDNRLLKSRAFKEQRRESAFKLSLCSCTLTPLGGDSGPELRVMKSCQKCPQSAVPRFIVRTCARPRRITVGTNTKCDEQIRTLIITIITVPAFV